MNSNAYQLFATPRSPFARRIRFILRKLKLPFEEKLIDAFVDNPDLWRANPIGTVPTLITPDCGPLSDSANLLEYFHEKTGAIWPNEFHLRAHVRQASVLAEGLMQYTVLHLQESKMHEVPSPSWVVDYLQTLDRTIKTIMQSPSHWWMHNNELTQGGWDLAIALDYLKFRLPEFKYDSEHPIFQHIKLLADQNAAFVETAPRL